MIWQCVTWTQILCQRLEDGRLNPKKELNKQKDLVVVCQCDRNDSFPINILKACLASVMYNTQYTVSICFLVLFPF